LIRRFVSSIFSDDYLSTVGVKISKKNVTAAGEELTLLLWDLEGQDDYGKINLSYIKGASGLILVVDGTRGETLSVALDLRNSALEILGPDTPHLFLINKNDLRQTWEVTDKILDALKSKSFEVMETSAKTGENIEEAFNSLATALVERAR
jgi:small GTP-binding protein